MLHGVKCSAFLVITLSLVVSAYYSGNSDVQLSIVAIRIGIMMWDSKMYFFCSILYGFRKQRLTLSLSFMCCCVFSMTVCMCISKADY